ncbi:ABC transporter permease [Stakelama sediminis]|uniref:Putative ABC transport system permease protein n=1 Tax=Stakelama sediminis TaxID=463200 RepID=A0A840YZA6_9SPHN|nr:ABC transporter permease [Stakelama sediminis]MBB5718935.1 putative ABC transport system permease protein [Stakelama sediminis]
MIGGSPFLTLYRSLTRHRLFAVLNIGGLALGIAVFLILFLFVQFERGYDRQLPGWNTLWLLQEHRVGPGESAQPGLFTMGNELLQLQADYPQLTGTRYDSMGVTVLQGPRSFAEPLAAVDTNYFRLFPFPALAGNPSQTLQEPNGLVITQRAATKYFGDQPALGRELTLRINGEDYSYRVGSVIADPPMQTTLKSDLYVPIVPARFANEWWDHWGSASLTTLLQFPDKSAAHRFEAALPGFLDRHAFPTGNVKKGKYYQSITPLSALHLATPGDRATVVTLALMGILTLLIAIMNYINLATARAGLRAPEVALRKVFGGVRSAIMAQFLGEAVVTVFVATLIGLAFAELALPLLNTAIGTSLSIRYIGAGGLALPLIAMVLVVGLIAGLYPAAILSRYRPARVLAAARTPDGGRNGTRLRQALIVAQFAIAIAFGISTSVMIAQVAHVRMADPGFQRQGLIIVRSFFDGSLDHAAQNDLMRAFRATPGVTSATVAQNAPGDQFTTNGDTVWLPGKPTVKPSMMTVQIGPDYFKTFGAHRLAGRSLDTSHGGDDLSVASGDRTGALNIVVNRTALKELGIASPQAAIGQAIDGTRPMRIVGVVGDMRFRDPREPVGGVIYMLDTARISSSMATIRYTGVDAATMTARLEKAWKSIAPTVPFDAKTVRQNLWQKYYQQDARRSLLFTIGAVLAVAIGCIGLYGLAAFDTSRRIREIGIRKTLGASTRDILRLLIGQFLRPVVLANLIAWPLAYFAMRKWLAGFDDRIALSPAYFLAASVIAALIAIATIFGQAWRVARAEPAKALRYE